MKRFLQNILVLRKDVGLKFYFMDFIFRKLLRQNADTKWAIHPTSTIYFPEKITRGLGVFPGDSPGNYLQAYNGISIGNFTNLGPNVGIISANHNLIDNAVHDDAPPIKIGNHCWIGMNAVILPTVILGDFTIVGAGAVVSKSFEEGYCVIAGNPAIKIKELDKNACIAFTKNKMKL
jgi:carbonic anhydrase/acetyltransferase-like protein (isoleucine patch superfamily)